MVVLGDLLSERERSIFDHVEPNSSIYIALLAISEHRLGRELYYAKERDLDGFDTRIVWRYQSSKPVGANGKYCWFSADQHTIRLMELAGVRHELLGVDI